MTKENLVIAPEGTDLRKAEKILRQYKIEKLPVVNKQGKLINYNSKADKVLFENDKEWILIDTQELIKYVKISNLKEIKVDDLLSNIDWNIILPKK